MSGLTREQAERGLAAGWNKDTLLAMNAALSNHEASGLFSSDHLFRVNICPDKEVGDYVHLYKSYGAGEVWKAMDEAGYQGSVIAYCDGSGTVFDKPAGIGAAIYRPWEQPQFIAQNIGLGTNNRAELAAVWAVLRAIPYAKQALTIFTDSQYTIGALTKDWTRNVNVGIIENIRADLAFRPHVQFEHVGGHEGVEGNEVVDRLANVGRKLVKAVTTYEGS